MKFLQRLVFTFLILILTITVFSQDTTPDLSQTYTEPQSGLTTLFPKGWVNYVNLVEDVDTEGAIILANSPEAFRFSESIQRGDMLVQILPPSLIESMVGGMEFDDAWSFVYEQLFSEAGIVIDIDEYSHIGRVTMIATSADPYVSWQGIVEVDDGVYAYVSAQTHEDTLDDAMPIFAAIIGNISYKETVYNTLFENVILFQNQAETFTFTYPDDPEWTAYEEAGVGVATNVGAIENFTGDTGQYLVVVSAVSDDEVDSAALTSAMLMGVASNMTIPLPPLLFNADGNEIVGLSTLTGLEEKSVGTNYATQTAIVGQAKNLPDFTISTDTQSPLQIEINTDLVGIIAVYGSPEHTEEIRQIIELVAISLKKPIKLSDVSISDIPLPNQGGDEALMVSYPEDWETFERGGFNVIGIPDGAQDAVRLIMSGHKLEFGETVEDALHSFTQLFGYQIFDTIELSDGRIAHIGTNLDFTEAVLEVEYKDDLSITMSYLPANPDDYMVGLPIALAILESIQLKFN